ncbi:MAG: hypothetical protein IKT60_06935 [Clostridia bacterium]|nr:hypothetical protein [Clostridia bacterium]
MLTIPTPCPQSDEHQADLIRDQIAAGADRMLIDVLEIFCDDDKREVLFSNVKRYLDRATAAGLRPGIWTTTLGWGDERDDDFKRKYGNATRITSFFGSTSGAVCVLDEEFTALCERNVADFARAGARLILLDDDLVLSVRPGLTCSCEKHLRLFAERTGREWTGPEVCALFTGGPSAERTAWMDLTGETIMDFCRRLRRAVDSVDPTIRMGLCASYTHYDLDGFDIKELVRLLAGEGNRPYLRLSGATYWARHAWRAKNQRLSGVLEFVRAQAAWLRDTDFELLDENDPHPRLTEVVPACDVELYDKAMLTQDRVGRLKYITLYADRATGELGYFNAHMENLPYDAKIIAAFAGKTAVGWRVFSAEHKVRDACLPEEYMGNSNLMKWLTQSHAGSLAAALGFPTRYEGKGPTLVFGEDARHLPDDAAFSPIVCDRTAAAILRERGISHTELPLEARELDFAEVPDVSDTLRALCPEVAFAPNIYPLISESADGRELSLMLLNDGDTDRNTAEVLLPANYMLKEAIHCEPSVCGNRLTLPCLKARDWACVVLTRA